MWGFLLRRLSVKRRSVRRLTAYDPGQSGRYIVNGLVERGHKVTILHTGRHEIDALPPTEVVPYIHADPFDHESFTTAIHDMTFDLVIA